ncbi:MAG: hypothetical protein PHF37_05460 [Phycisphaerae bacterium]|nr:hypothetical protein [Phycisphaerae bacterium]
MAKSKTNHNLSGSIYKNGKRWWWKVKLPGEEKTKARPLRPLGSSMATTDYSVAIECAKMMLSQSMLKCPDKFEGKVTTVGELVSKFI